MAVCSSCGNVGSAFDKYCQVCGQEMSLDPVQEAGFQASRPNGADQNGAHAASLGAASQESHGASATTAVAQARLIVRTIADGGQGDDREVEEFILDGRDVAIGRAPSCDIVLHGDQLASRRHALLRNKGRFYTVVDLGSSNGTYLNDLEIREEVELHDGDSLKIGSHELAYSTGPASPNASLAGVRMSGSLPPAPLPETNPSMDSIQVSPVQPAASAPAQEPPFILTGAPEPEPEPDIAASEPVPAAEPEAPAPVAFMPEPLQPPSSPFSENGPRTADIEDEVELGAGERPSSNLDQLRAQLNEVGAVLTQVADASAALAQKADEEARAADRLRATLAGMRDSVIAILQAPPSEANEPDPELEELIGVARQTAENPRHLDFVTTLAAHAPQLVEKLEASRYAADAARMRTALETLRAELDDVLK